MDHSVWTTQTEDQSGNYTRSKGVIYPTVSLWHVRSSLLFVITYVAETRPIRVCMCSICVGLMWRELFWWGKDRCEAKMTRVFVWCYLLSFCWLVATHAGVSPCRSFLSFWKGSLTGPKKKHKSYCLKLMWKMLHVKYFSPWLMLTYKMDRYMYGMP